MEANTKQNFLLKGRARGTKKRSSSPLQDIIPTKKKVTE